MQGYLDQNFGLGGTFRHVRGHLAYHCGPGVLQVIPRHPVKTNTVDLAIASSAFAEAVLLHAWLLQLWLPPGLPYSILFERRSSITRHGDPLSSTQA